MYLLAKLSLFPLPTKIYYGTIFHSRCYQCGVLHWRQMKGVGASMPPTGEQSNPDNHYYAGTRRRFPLVFKLHSNTWYLNET